MLTRSCACLLLAAALVSCSPAADKKGAKMAEDEKLVLFEDFSTGMADWWVEGGERVWVAEGKLHVKADPPDKGPGYVATVWCKTPVPANVKVEFDACVVHSAIEVNNINFFLCYSDPSGQSLFQTRESRKSGGYKLYHSLNGHIFTFLNDPKKQGGSHADGSAKARMRMRRCPGFHLMTECYDYHCKTGVTYHVTITKRGGNLTFGVDGRVYLCGQDPNPLPAGLIGLRTYRTELWWDNIKVTALGPLAEKP